ncbi:phage tail protein [Rhodococcus erythropolis]|uniref:Gp37-like protein n=1 Tax=Rhodococcus erythropolis TaxID=1833 RepID=UPI002949530A|nr:phage tail protein [Rhodococcus erythropolis]MDV6274099.1 phage tail protein [Rhodococcus erythropolis]
MTAPAGIDFDTAFTEITNRLKAEEKRRLLPADVRLYDGDANFRGTVKRESAASFQYLDNETGIASLEMPLDYYLSRWIADIDSRGTTNVLIRAEKDGSRWCGLMDEFKIIKGDDGRKFIRVTFKHDYEGLKHILAWSNPFLPAEVQFPRLWVCFGRARWALKTTLLVNLMRLESSLFMLPDDPMDPNGWNNFDQSTWWNVVKPDLEPDHSVGAIVHSRFKNMHDVSKKIVADAQLSWEPRRYFDGDPPPWPGANLRNGCIVWDLIDKSGWTTGTSFGGNIFEGLFRELINIGADGITENVEQVDDPNVPGEYLIPGFKGTIPSMPGVVYREGEHTGIQASEFSHKPATDVGVVAGGHSMPGVNELISAAVQMVGDLTAMIPGVPPLGGVADAILKPLYTDVFLAFGKWKSPQRAQRLGGSHYHEKWAEGGDRAYTLAFLLAMRAGMWSTRETNRVTLAVADGAPWRIGQRGHGHFFLGDRVAFSVLGMKPGRLFVERVSELTLAWDRDSTPGWQIQIGQREAEDPVARMAEDMQDFLGMLQELGVA